VNRRAADNSRPGAVKLFGVERDEVVAGYGMVLIGVVSASRGKADYVILGAGSGAAPGSLGNRDLRSTEQDRKRVVQIAKTLRRVAVPAALMTVGSTAINAAPG
jgi:hypothetical protein